MKRTLWGVVCTLVLGIPLAVYSAVDVTITGVGNLHATTSDTAAALDHDPVACGASTFVTDVSSAVVLTCAQVNFSNLAGTATDAQIPNLDTLSTGLTGDRCVRVNNATGHLEAAAADCGTGGGGSSAFNDITTGTNTTATMTVGTGATLTTSGSGTIVATTAAALVANGGNCSPGNAPLGVSATGAAENCFDVATQAELDTHTSDTAAHSATSANTASRIVARDGSGNFSAGTITATLSGNASTASALDHDPSACGANNFVTDVNNTVTLTCAQPSSSTLSDGNNLAKLNTSNTWSSGVKQTFAPNSTNAGFNVGSVAGDPSSPANGDMWYDSTANELTARINGANVALGAGGGGGTISSGTSGNTTYYTGSTTVDDSTGLTLSSTAVLTVKNGITNITSSTSLDAHNLVTCDPTSGAVTLTLPAASSTTKGRYKITNTTGTNGCSIARAGSDLINGSSTALPLTAQYTTVEIELIYTGTTDATHPTNWVATTSKSQFGYIQLPVQSAKLPTSNAAIIMMDEPRPKLLFDTSTSWCASWTVDVPGDYAGSPSFDYLYSMTSATSGTLAFDVSLWKTTTGEAVDAQTESYDTTNNCDDGAVPGTAGRMKRISCNLTNDDGVVADDILTIKVCRNVANDNASGNAELMAMKVKYLRN